MSATQVWSGRLTRRAAAARRTSIGLVPGFEDPPLQPLLLVPAAADRAMFQAQ